MHLASPFAHRVRSTFLLCAGLTVVVTPAAFGQLPEPLRNPAANPVGAISTSPLAQATGTGSCAATACHGGRRDPLGLKGSEYSFFATYDQHRRAYGVLFDDRSKTIEKNYRQLDSLDKAKPELDATCLSCHVRPGIEPKDVSHEQAFFADGVGCESCHGNAEKYLAPHTESWWRGLSGREKHEQYGMVDTKSLAGRVDACAKCHVGTPQAEVNHDLIAAGHPRLLYEFSNQEAKYAKHWRVEDDKARYPDLEARSWALSQAVATDGVLALLEARAERASKPGRNEAPWPEFTEYDCYACHHDLKSPSVRQGDGKSSSPPGSLPWGGWDLPGVREVAAVRGMTGLGGPKTAIGELEIEMSKSGPRSKKVADLARKARAEIAPLIVKIEETAFTSAEVEALLKQVFASAERAAPSDWTDFARTYVAILALANAQADLTGRPIDVETLDRLDKLGRNLSVPAVRPSDEKLVDSPALFDPKKAKIELRTIARSLPR